MRDRLGAFTLASEVEKEAMRIVMDYVRKQGRDPKDVSNNKKEVGYDIVK